MTIETGSPLSRDRIHWLVAASGLAALSWEVMWQIKSSLALGVSARGTALTLAVTMGGMSLGAFLMGHALRDRVFRRPLRLYGILEIIVGIAGLCLGSAFQAIEKLDTYAYATMPGSASWIHIGSIIAALGVPTVCMGATLPVFGLVGRQSGTSIAALYGLNTLGAAAGALLAAFFLIPQFGVTHAIWIISAINFSVGLYTFLQAPGKAVATEHDIEEKSQPQLGPVVAQSIVVVTGFTTFALEVAWFRSFTAAFRSTTDAFAIMLASVLLALGAAAEIVTILKKKNVPLGTLISWAGILILVATPVVERFDIFLLSNAHAVKIAPAVLISVWVKLFLYISIILRWFVMTLYVIGPPVLLLGIALPWVLDDQRSSRRLGIIYASNTMAAIVGAISAAWFFLPTIGFARTSWLAGGLVAVAGILIAPRARRVVWGALAIAALLIAVTFESGVGRTRIQGDAIYDSGQFSKILGFYEGPEATVSAVEYSSGGRSLIVDGFVASAQRGRDEIPYEHYMAWMGHLPMLLHPDPQNALVICFGTGQTANAVRNENPKSLDIVDINPRVFKLAGNFPANQDVIADPRVKTIAMDGRAYIRRTTKTYDIITLEPMPPNYAGVNALYSKEFYEFARQKLSSAGIIAQWVPFHLISPHAGASIAKTFLDVFPNAILWIDPFSKTGILLGSKDDNHGLGMVWPGFGRTRIARDLSEEDVQKAVLLDQKGMQRYSAYGEVISDDNQLLAYGRAIISAQLSAYLQKESFDLLNQVAK